MQIKVISEIITIIIIIIVIILDETV